MAYQIFVVEDDKKLSEMLQYNLRRNGYEVLVAGDGRHGLRQAARASDYTAFFNMDEDRAGYLVEYNDTQAISTRPAAQLTEQYITGRFG